jgi:dipeptidase E
MEESMHRVLLISSSRVHRGGYLDHCESEIRSFLGNVGRVLFVPFALGDQPAYAEKVRERLGRMGLTVNSLHEARDPIASLQQAESIFIGGGNTFRLLDALYRERLLETIRQRVEAGAPYMGSSAGSNVAGPTIKTTNDMPIVQPPSFDALRLVPFNLNPHYLDPDPLSTHMGETREERIREFHELNDPPVVGLREGAMLRIEGKSALLRGSVGARLFVKGGPAREFSPGAALDFLVE